MADYSTAASEARWGAGPAWSGAPRAARASRARSRRVLFAAAVVSVAHDARDRLLAAARDDRVLRRRPDRRLPVRDEVDAAVRRRPAVLRRAPAGLGHALPDRHRPARGDPASGSCSRHLPGGVRAAPRAQGRQAGARGARRRADDRLRLLRADVLHARGAAQRARARRQPVQRAVGRASSSASSCSRRSRRSPRTRCRRCRSRCARASAGLGANRVQTAIRVVFPAALSGVVAALVLGASRAIGETVIILIAGGQTREPRRSTRRSPTSRWRRSSPRPRAATSRPARSSTRRSSSSA